MRYNTGMNAALCKDQPVNTPLLLNGVARNNQYVTCLRPSLISCTVDEFDINIARSFGIINMGGEGNTLGYSVWVSPKRTRSYPFARIYNTYHLPKKVTIVPIIKDEGIGGDNDRINFITLSWMNLMNVYVILAWYDDAVKHPRLPGKITRQQMQSDYVRERLHEIAGYHQTALHWNMMHFQRDFESIYRRAVERYAHISVKTGVAVHPASKHLNALDTFLGADGFSVEAFKQATLPRSLAAAQRETATSHIHERLEEGEKNYFRIVNWLGGEYYLTADEIFIEGDTVIIQEAKNGSKKRLPSENDIKDGLFKLILFANMDKLMMGDREIPFAVRLKLTGQLSGSLRLPANDDTLSLFAKMNGLSRRNIDVMRQLNNEVIANPRLSLLLTGTYD